MAIACELWITAGDEFTCAVSLDRNGAMSILKIALRGAINPCNGYVAYIILSRTDDDDFDCVEIDARDVEFFSKNNINTHSIVCLLEVINGISRQGRSIALSVSNTAVKEVLERAYRRQNAQIPKSVIPLIDKYRLSTTQRDF